MPSVIQNPFANENEIKNLRIKLLHRPSERPQRLNINESTSQSQLDIKWFDVIELNSVDETDSTANG